MVKNVSVTLCPIPHRSFGLVFKKRLRVSATAQPFAKHQILEKINSGTKTLQSFAHTNANFINK